MILLMKLPHTSDTGFKGIILELPLISERTPRDGKSLGLEKLGSQPQNKEGAVLAAKGEKQSVVLPGYKTYKCQQPAMKDILNGTIKALLSWLQTITV